MKYLQTLNRQGYANIITFDDLHKERNLDYDGKEKNCGLIGKILDFLLWLINAGRWFR